MMLQQPVGMGWYCRVCSQRHKKEPGEGKAKDQGRRLGETPVSRLDARSRYGVAPDV